MSNFTTPMLDADQTIRCVVGVNFQKGRPAEVKAEICVQLVELLWLDRSGAVYLKSVSFTFLRPIELAFIGKLPQNDSVAFMVGIFPLHP
jgi:hypothetical protein